MELPSRWCLRTVETNKDWAMEELGSEPASTGSLRRQSGLADGRILSMSTSKVLTCGRRVPGPVLLPSHLLFDDSQHSLESTIHGRVDIRSAILGRDW